MHKSLKRILLLVAAALFAVAAVAMVGVHQIRRAPAWYSPGPPDASQWSAAADSADQKVAQTLSWAAESHAHAVRQRRATAAGGTLPAADAAPGPQTISFTDTELNAFFAKWANAPTGLPEQIAQFATGLRLYIDSGRLIVAGKLIKSGIIASVQLNPSIDETGKLSMKIAEVDAGCLPVPRSFLPLDAARDNLLQQLPDLQSAATFSPDGIANSSAVAAHVAKFFVHVLDGSPAPAVIFLPSDVTHARRSIPVKLTAMQLSDHNLNATIEELTDGERATLLQTIKAPYAGEGDAGD